MPLGCTATRIVAVDPGVPVEAEFTGVTLPELGSILAEKMVFPPFAAQNRNELCAGVEGVDPDPPEPGLLEPGVEVDPGAAPETLVELPHAHRARIESVAQNRGRCPRIGFSATLDVPTPLELSSYSIQPRHTSILRLQTSR